MKENQDRLVLLKNKYQQAISAKEIELRDLQSKLQLIDELEADADKLEPAPDAGLKYADGKKMLIDQVLDAVKTIGTKGVSVSKVAKHLQQNGFPVNGKNFSVSVGTSLRRLASRNEIKSELKEGKRVFSPVETNQFQ